MHFGSFCFLFSSHLHGIVPSFIKKIPDPTVTLSSGVVVGTATPVSNQADVTDLANAYLGIPFASSPPLRFAPPEPPAAWPTPLVAQTLQPACLQQFQPGDGGKREAAYFNNPGFPPPPESEDCMYLNVFTPPEAGPSNLKPVLFWIFGGNLEIGTGSLIYYNGSSLAVNEDVVVVTSNYRTNIFGFSSSPEIPVGQQNVGFLDQRYALQWVQDNIGEKETEQDFNEKATDLRFVAQFGGDPSKVTVFGESAGAFSIKQLLANPPDPLPFRAAIMASQQDLAVGTGTDNYLDVVAYFHCEAEPSPIECLRKVRGTDIQTYIQSKTIAFPPVIGDGTNEGPNTLESIQSGRFANVPILIGTNANEGTIFTQVLGLGPDLAPVDFILGPLANVTNVTQTILDTYSGHVPDEGTALISQILTDFFFTCTTKTFSTAIQQAGRQPVWRYRYDAAFENLQIFPDGGAYHSSDIPIVFGTYPLDNEVGNVTQTEIELSAYMQRIWAGFARDPMKGPGWPKLGSNGGVELGIIGGKDAPAGATTAPLLLADYPCALYEPILLSLNIAF